MTSRPARSWSRVMHWMQSSYASSEMESNTTFPGRPGYRAKACPFHQRGSGYFPTIVAGSSIS